MVNLAVVSHGRAYALFVRHVRSPSLSKRVDASRNVLLLPCRSETGSRDAGHLVLLYGELENHQIPTCPLAMPVEHSGQVYGLRDLADLFALHV